MLQAVFVWPFAEARGCQGVVYVADPPGAMSVTVTGKLHRMIFKMKSQLANSILKARCVSESALKKNPTDEQQEFYEQNHISETR